MSPAVFESPPSRASRPEAGRGKVEKEVFGQKIEIDKKIAVSRLEELYKELKKAERPEQQLKAAYAMSQELMRMRQAGLKIDEKSTEKRAKIQEALNAHRAELLKRGKPHQVAAYLGRMKVLGYLDRVTKEEQRFLKNALETEQPSVSDYSLLLVGTKELGILEGFPPGGSKVQERLKSEVRKAAQRKSRNKGQKKETTENSRAADRVALRLVRVKAIGMGLEKVINEQFVEEEIVDTGGAVGKLDRNFNTTLAERAAKKDWEGYARLKRYVDCVRGETNIAGTVQSELRGHLQEMQKVRPSGYFSYLANLRVLSRLARGDSKIFDVMTRTAAMESDDGESADTEEIVFAEAPSEESADMDSVYSMPNSEAEAAADSINDSSSFDPESAYSAESVPADSSLAEVNVSESRNYELTPEELREASFERRQSSSDQELIDEEPQNITVGGRIKHGFRKLLGVFGIRFNQGEEEQAEDREESIESMEDGVEVPVTESNSGLSSAEFSDDDFPSYESQEEIQNKLMRMFRHVELVNTEDERNMIVYGASCAGGVCHLYVQPVSDPYGLTDNYEDVTVDFEGHILDPNWQIVLKPKKIMEDSGSNWNISDLLNSDSEVPENPLLGEKEVRKEVVPQVKVGDIYVNNKGEAVKINRLNVGEEYGQPYIIGRVIDSEGVESFDDEGFGEFKYLFLDEAGEVKDWKRKPENRGVEKKDSSLSEDLSVKDREAIRQKLEAEGVKSGAIIKNQGELAGSYIDRVIVNIDGSFDIEIDDGISLDSSGSVPYLPIDTSIHVPAGKSLDDVGWEIVKNGLVNPGSAEGAKSEDLIEISSETFSEDELVAAGVLEGKKSDSDVVKKAYPFDDDGEDVPVNNAKLENNSKKWKEREKDNAFLERELREFFGGDEALAAAMKKLGLEKEAKFTAPDSEFLILRAIDFDRAKPVLIFENTAGRKREVDLEDVIEGIDDEEGVPEGGRLPDRLRLKKGWTPSIGI